MEGPQTAASPSTTSQDGIFAPLPGFSAKIAEGLNHLITTARNSVETLKHEVTNTLESALRIPDTIQTWFTRHTDSISLQSMERAAGPVAAIAAIASFYGMGARPASAQTINFSNVAGVGANIDHASLVAFGGSSRLNSGGGGPVEGPFSQRGFFNIDSGQSYTLLANTEYTISFTEYLVGVNRSSGARFGLSATNPEAVNFSFTWRDSSGDVQSNLSYEPTIPSSAISMTRRSDLFLSAPDGFTNSMAQFERYEFEFKYTPTQNITATGAGVNYAMGSGQSIYGANVQGGAGQFLERIASGGTATQANFENGVAFGVTITPSQVAGAATPEPAAGFLLLTGGLAFLTIGGKIYRGKVSMQENEKPLL